MLLDLASASFMDLLGRLVNVTIHFLRLRLKTVW